MYNCGYTNTDNNNEIAKPQGLESLQHAGICHRDMSLENLLVHESGALIIDMGMCLRLPVHVEHEESSLRDGGPFSSTAAAASAHHHLSMSFGNMNIMNGNTGGMPQQPSSATTSATLPYAAAAAAVVSDSNNSSSGSNNIAPVSAISKPPPSPPLSIRSQRRYMVKPQGTCGKWIYMSPEVYKNSAPFDGFAVDMWAAGVILFLMLTGFPPWDRACPTDERFRYMSAGYLVQMLTEWELGISPDAMDLLQRMLFLDPKDRLSLDQVRAHPWMVNGPCQPPDNVVGGGASAAAVATL